MQLQTIKKLLDLPDYKVIHADFSSNEYHFTLEKDQRTKAICSHCKTSHLKGHHSTKSIVVEDFSLSGKRVFLHLKREFSRCLLTDLPF